ncbi:DUF58 domain-containing protein [Streptodolium elevatio]|uniref:DUF58 domain-containing protein n=1 Tax=Streptodolium elevatio TaxID=3157996 RepID=A0ABV3DD21_9ACTN
MTRTAAPRPTPAGWSVLAVSVLLFGGGWAAGHPEPAALGLTGLVLVGVALADASSAPRLTAERRLNPARVARGDPAGGVVGVTNEGRRPCRGLIVEDHCDGAAVSVRLPVLAPGATVTARYVLPTARRGRIPVGPLHLVRRDLFGLAHRTIPIGAAATLLVQPRVTRTQLPPSGREHHLEGPTSDTADTGTTTFHALRDYTQGDDLRRVHWRATARTGRLMVRQMADVSLPVTTVLLDCRAASYQGRSPDADFELAVDVAASLGSAAAVHNFPLRLRTGTGGAGLGGASGRGVDAAALLAFLTDVRLADGSDAGAADPIGELRRESAQGVLALVTGHADPTAGRRLAAAARDYEHVVVVRVGARQGSADGPPTPTGATAKASDPASGAVRAAAFDAARGAAREPVRHITVDTPADVAAIWRPPR